jgi:hypothetical protein
MHYQQFNKELISIHVWRQTQTQSTIDNFYEEDFNILNPRRDDRGSGDGIFRMEFPLMQWLVAGLYKIFGQHLIISRLFMFIVGLMSVFGIFKFLQVVLKNDVAAIIGAWAFNFSPSFYYYTVNPLPDNLALCFSIFGLYFIFKWINYDKLINLVLGSFLFSLAALTKLPFILYFVIIFTYLIIKLIKRKTTVKFFFSRMFFSGVFLILPLAWYIQVIGNWEGNGIVKGVLENNIPMSQIFGYLQHNLFSVLPELLLNYGSVGFFILGFYFIFKRKDYKKPKFIILLVWSLSILAYFFFEINMIAKIHDYYLFPFYPILFLIVSYGAYAMYSSKAKVFKIITIVILLLLPFTAYIRMHVRWNLNDPGFNKDLLIYKSELRKAVPNDALCVVGNDISHYIFFYYIDKKGWGFEEDNLSKPALESMINEGAEYLFTDSRFVDENPQIQDLLENKTDEFGSIIIWKLKK